MNKRYFIKIRKNGFHGAICYTLDESKKAVEKGYIEITGDDYIFLRFSVVKLIKKPKKK